MISWLQIEFYVFQMKVLQCCNMQPFICCFCFFNTFFFFWNALFLFNTSKIFVLYATFHTDHVYVQPWNVSPSRLILKSELYNFYGMLFSNTWLTAGHFNFLFPTSPLPIRGTPKPLRWCFAGGLSCTSYVHRSYHRVQEPFLFVTMSYHSVIASCVVSCFLQEMYWDW